MGVFSTHVEFSVFLAYLARHPKLEATRGGGVGGRVGKVDLISKYVEDKKRDSEGTFREYIWS